MSFEEAKQLMINCFGVEPDLTEDDYRQLAEEYNIDIEDDE